MSLIAAGPASSVTFGTEVSNPQLTRPWAVAIYEDAGDLDPSTGEAVCSGTALDQYTVLTAAHCVDGQFLAIGYGGARLADQTLEPVAAIIGHPGYGDQAIVNDVAVVRTLDPMDIDVFPRIATKAEARKARKSATKLTILGWGRNQNGVQNGRLQTATLKAQTKAAKKIYRSQFLSSKTLAAGKYIKSTRTYAGSCNGDSGGPLVMTVKGRPVVVGITSYAAKSCLAKVPSVFTSTGDYRNWINPAISRLPGEADLQNTALPYNYVDGNPRITGTPSLGQTLNCDHGHWTDNAESFDYQWRWASDDDSVYSYDQTYLVEEADLGEEIICRVIGRSDAGTQEADSDPLLIPAA